MLKIIVIDGSKALRTHFPRVTMIRNSQPLPTQVHHLKLPFIIAFSCIPLLLSGKYMSGYRAERGRKNVYLRAHLVTSLFENQTAPNDLGK